jgi:sulfate transport system substrate-binding protein
VPNPDWLSTISGGPVRRPITTAVSLLAAALLAAGCGGASDSSDATAAAGASGGDGTAAELSLVAYSTPQVVYDELIPAWAKTPEGRGVSFKTSFGASGEQSRAVEAGLDADVVSFSIEPDVTRLVDAGLVAADGTRARTRARSRPPSSPSSSARATRRTSAAGPTWSGRA